MSSPLATESLRMHANAGPEQWRHSGAAHAGSLILTFDAAASQTQTADISLCGRLAANLITCQVAVEEQQETFYLSHIETFKPTVCGNITEHH